MLGHRPAAWLCVLLAHALLLLLWVRAERTRPAREKSDAPRGAPITLYPLPDESHGAENPAVPRRPVRRPRDARARSSQSGPEVRPKVAPEGGSSPPRIDWSLEAGKAASRMVESRQQAGKESQRFSGPQGTWPSLEKRPASGVREFPWKPGIDAPEYDEQGRRILRPADGCEAKTSLTPPGISFSCALDKPKARGDLFEDMDEYFDERRLPDDGVGNGTEPQARRPSN